MCACALSSLLSTYGMCGVSWCMCVCVCVCVRACVCVCVCGQLSRFESWSSDSACRVLPTDKSIGGERNFVEFPQRKKYRDQRPPPRHRPVVWLTCYDDNDDALSATLSQNSALYTCSPRRRDSRSSIAKKLGHNLRYEIINCICMYNIIIIYIYIYIYICMYNIICLRGAAVWHNHDLKSE